MKKKVWLNFQREILEERGYFKFYLVLLILTHAIMGDTRIPVLAYFPRLAVEVVGILLLTIVYFVGKSERTKKESRTLIIYWLVLLVAAGAALFYMLQP